MFIMTQRSTYGKILHFQSEIVCADKFSFENRSKYHKSEHQEGWKSHSFICIFSCQQQEASSRTSDRRTSLPHVTPGKADSHSMFTVIPTWSLITAGKLSQHSSPALHSWEGIPPSTALPAPQLEKLQSRDISTPCPAPGLSSHFSPAPRKFLTHLSRADVRPASSRQVLSLKHAQQVDFISFYYQVLDNHIYFK